MYQIFFDTDHVYHQPVANDLCDWADPWSALAFLSRKYRTWKALAASGTFAFPVPPEQFLRQKRQHILELWRALTEDATEATARGLAGEVACSLAGSNSAASDPALL